MILLTNKYFRKKFLVFLITKKLNILKNFYNICHLSYYIYLIEIIIIKILLINLFLVNTSLKRKYYIIVFK